MSSIATPTMDAATRNEIFEKNIGLVRMATHRWRNQYPSAAKGLGGEEDVFQLASIAALRAIERFDPTRGRLSTWIIQYVCLTLRRRAATSGLIHLPAYLDHEKRSELRARLTPMSLSLMLPNDDDWQPVAPPCERLDFDAIDAAEAAMKNLPPRSRLILRRRVAGDTRRELAQRLGVSAERVRQLECRALGWLRKMCAEARVVSAAKVRAPVRARA